MFCPEAFQKLAGRLLSLLALCEFGDPICRLLIHNDTHHRRHGQPAPTDPHAETFLAFGRVFSGVAHEGATVQVRTLQNLSNYCHKVAWIAVNLLFFISCPAGAPNFCRCQSTAMIHGCIHTYIVYMHLSCSENDHAIMLAQVLSAAYSPARPEQLRGEARISGLYLMMGRGLERLQVLCTCCGYECCCNRSTQSWEGQENQY